MSRPNLIRDAYLAGDLSPADLLAFHRRTFGDARMEGEGDQQEPAAPEKPSGVSDEDWDALGDPGKRAIVRERERATRAEQELAAARAAATPKPAPPKKDDEPKGDPKPPAKDGDPQDVSTLIQQAVQAAMQPFLERDQQRETQDRARAVAEAVTTAAAAKLHDGSDALVNLDLSTLTDGNGNADASKITAALDDLVQRKPHLAKVVDTSRRPGAGSLLGGGQAPAPSTDDQVKAALAKMQASSGVKFAEA